LNRTKIKAGSSDRAMQKIPVNLGSDWHHRDTCTWAANENSRRQKSTSEKSRTRAGHLAGAVELASRRTWLENTDAGGRNELLRLTEKAAERINREQTENHERIGQSQQIEDQAHPMRDSEAAKENLRQR
jgi:hypothetical protein